MACSDLHYTDDPHCVEKQRFEEGLRQLYAYAERQDYKPVDAVYIVGDFATSGSTTQMEMVQESLNREIRPGTRINLSLASHEYQCPDGETGARERFEKIYNQNADTHVVINGFHFISVSTTNGCRFQEPQITFCRQALHEAHQDGPKKPIFFFQHPHPRNTVYGSIVWANSDLMPTLLPYPQVITFSGHSHAPINDPRSIHQEHFTSVGTGTFSYFELDEFDKAYGTRPPDKGNAAQMLIVEVHDDNSVRIIPYDVLTNQPFHEGWVIEKPWDPDSFIYTAEKRLRNPAKLYFPDRANIETSAVGDRLHVVFDAAQCREEPINDYVLTLRDKDGVVQNRVCFWSSFYILPMTDKPAFDIPLPPPGEYELTVRARGFWHNSSENELRCRVFVD